MLISSVSNPVAPRRSAFLQLACVEPFRLFFPLGILVGISAVSLWPLYFSGLHKFYPGVMHARLMIEGFLAAFVFGFLGTAAPRLTGTRHLAGWELGWLATFFAGTVAAHVGMQTVLGDALFLALLLSFASILARRFAKRDDMPPPSFALVALGFLNAVAGTSLLLIGAAGNLSVYALGAMLLNQSFVLMLVLGVGSFLLPRFLNLPPKPELPESRSATTVWRKHAAIATVVGLIITASFFLEIMGVTPRIAALIRFIAAGAYLVREIPFHRTNAPRLTIVRCLQAAIVLLVLGLLFPTLWPVQRLAGLHVIFIGGFTLVTFTVATRVVLGHSGNSHLFRTRLPFLIGTAVLLLLALGLRAAGDFVPAFQGRFLTDASYCWMAAAALWGFRVLPKVLVPDSE